MRQPTIASLFTGGGLVECGAVMAGYEPIWGVERDPNNIRFSNEVSNNYELNFGSHMIRRLVEEVNWGQLEKPDLLWASPVCKRLSVANRDAKTENHLDLSAASGICRALFELKPKVFCLENVRGYQHTNSLQQIKSQLTQLGYSVFQKVINTANYGVPQDRHRLIMCATLGSLPRVLPLSNTIPQGGWYEAVEDLISTFPTRELKHWQLPILEKAKLPLLVDSKNPRSYSNALPTHRRMFEPSFTITDMTGTMPCIVLPKKDNEHEIRQLNPRGLARLQTVPDWYILPEMKSVAVPLIANGVPCELVKQILESFLPQLQHVTHQPNKDTNFYTG